jgi:phospholipid/cholesterol/gamma-HCH transport system permease protein
VLAGVIGSKIAGELGNMRVSEQIDALEIMGINTKGLPRSTEDPRFAGRDPDADRDRCRAGHLGRPPGGLRHVGHHLRRLPTISGLLMNFIPYNVFFALSKAYTFSFLIASIPAYFGYHVSGGALEIGRASTKSVVVTCVTVLFADYILAALLL